MAALSVFRAFEPDRDQKIEGKRAHQDKNQGADEWTDRESISHCRGGRINGNVSD